MIDRLTDRCINSAREGEIKMGNTYRTIVIEPKYVSADMKIG